jgi:predicted restriction endonuclease
LQPLGSPHEGPDVPENVLVLCPNHHADFEHGMIRVDPETLTLTHRYDVTLTGRTLTTEHEIGEEYLRYHNQQVVETDG